MANTIKLISTEEILPLRHKVLWPTKPADFCRHVEEDDKSLHYGLFLEDKLIAGMTILNRGGIAQMRKVATEQAYQNQGYGSQLLRFVLQDLTQRNIKLLWCDARKTAVGFYQKFGFKIVGEEYILRTLPHRKMELELNSKP